MNPEIDFLKESDTLLSFLNYLYPSVWDEQLQNENEIVIFSFLNEEVLKMYLYSFRQKEVYFPKIGCVNIKIVAFDNLPDFIHEKLDKVDKTQNYITLVGVQTKKTTFQPLLVSVIKKDSKRLSLLKRHCTFCEMQKAMIECSLCKKTVYCSEKCQLLHWQNMHKNFCE